MKTLYSVLGCEESVPSDSLKQRYFELLRELHPDKAPSGQYDVDLFMALTKAWETLREESSRRAYDDWLHEQRLREQKELLWGEVHLEEDTESGGENSLRPREENFEEWCRCGGQYLAEGEELRRALDFLLVECSNCSLCIKVWLRKQRQQIKNDGEE